MSYQLCNTLQECPNAQLRLEELWGLPGVNGSFTPPSPALQFIQANKNGIQELITLPQAKIQRVNVVYDKIIPQSVIVEDIANPTCVATAKYGQCIETYDFDTTQNFSTGGEAVAITDLTRLCENNADYFFRLIAKHISAMDVKLSNLVATSLSALVGAWSDETASQYTVVADELILASKKAGSTDPNPYMLQDLKSALMLSEYNDNTALFGGLTAHNAIEILQSGCCANSGLDLRAILTQYGIASAYDRYVAAAFGGKDHSVALQAGAFQLLEYTQSRWKDGVPDIIGDANYFYFPVTSPNTGASYDIIVSNNCGVISIIPIGTFKLVSAPNDIFPEDHSQFGVNYGGKVGIVNT